MNFDLPIKRILITLFLTIVSLLVLWRTYIDYKLLYVSFDSSQLNENFKYTLFWTQNLDQKIPYNCNKETNYYIKNDKLNFVIKTPKFYYFKLVSEPNQIKSLNIDYFISKNADSVDLSGKIALDNQQRAKIKSDIVFNFYVFIILSVLFFFFYFKLINRIALYKIIDFKSRNDIAFLFLFFAFLVTPVSYLTLNSSNVLIPPPLFYLLAIN